MTCRIKAILLLLVFLFGRPLAILVDGQVVVAPRIIQKIKDESQISGSFTLKEAESIASAINNK